MVLAKSGYVANQVQTDGCLRAIRLLMSALPGTFCLLAAVCLLGYSISNKRYEEIMSRLQ